MEEKDDVALVRAWVERILAADKTLGDIIEMLEDPGDLADARWAAGLAQMVKKIKTDISMGDRDE